MQIKVGMIELSSRLHKKGGESAINYIKRFQNAQALSFSVGNSYSEDQIMHTFLDNFSKVEIFSPVSKPPERIEKRGNVS